MTETILVTGAAGFAGSHLLDLLADDAASVLAWHRPGHPPPARTGVQLVPIDLLDRQSVVDAVARARPTVVYHCAGAAHVGRAWNGAQTTFATNVLGTHYLLEGLRLVDVEARVVIPSSALVYRTAGEPLTEDDALVPSSPYGLSKLSQELVANLAGSNRVHVMIARAFNHLGPRQDPSFAASGFARQIAEIESGRQAPEISVGNLDARRDMTDVRDTVRAYRALAARGRSGRAYNVCSGRVVAIRDLVDLLIARSTVPIRVHVDPAKFRPSDVPILAGDSSRARNELGWTARIPLEQTLEETLAYWRETVKN